MHRNRANLAFAFASSRCRPEMAVSGSIRQREFRGNTIGATGPRASEREICL